MAKVRFYKGFGRIAFKVRIAAAESSYLRG